MSWSPADMARQAAKEIEDGAIVNLGIGLPTLIANELAHRPDVWVHTENGILGMGPYPYEGEEDARIINAGKETVTVVAGGSCFDSARSFAMIRGGHVSLAILGAMQVSVLGDLANWSVPGGKTIGIGGAMDLAAGARRVIALTRHATKEGEPKLVRRCSYPLTALAVVDRVITDLGVFDVRDEAFCTIVLAPGVTEATVRKATEGRVR